MMVAEPIPGSEIIRRHQVSKTRIIENGAIKIIAKIDDDDITEYHKRTHITHWFVESPHALVKSPGTEYLGLSTRWEDLGSHEVCWYVTPANPCGMPQLPQVIVSDPTDEKAEQQVEQFFTSFASMALVYGKIQADEISEAVRLHMMCEYESDDIAEDARTSVVMREPSWPPF
jgi:hypothetical protein